MEQPILLFGMPRSGTTWLGKLFDSHPDTLYRHEPDSWHKLPMPRYPGTPESRQYAKLLQSFVGGMAEIKALHVAGKRPLFAKNYLSASQLSAIKGAAWLARVGSQFNYDLPVLLHSEGGGYPKRRMVWKSIESLGRLGVILNILPESRGIHILRHPCGYIASVLRGLKQQQFSDNTSVDQDYGIFHAVVGSPLGDAYELSDTMLAGLTPEERLTWRWVLTNEKALLEAKPTGRMLCMRYEDVCLDPMSRVQQMFEFTGLELVEQTRKFVAASTTNPSKGYYSVYKNPETAAMRWREELSSETVSRIMAIVKQSCFASYYAADSIEAPRNL